MKSIYQINGITSFNRKKRIFIVIILAFLLVHTAIRRETNLSIILNILLRLLVLVSESYDNPMITKIFVFYILPTLTFQWISKGSYELLDKRMFRLIKMG